MKSFILQKKDLKTRLNYSKIIDGEFIHPFSKCFWSTYYAQLQQEIQTRTSICYLKLCIMYILHALVVLWQIFKNFETYFMLGQQIKSSL